MDRTTCHQAFALVASSSTELTELLQRDVPKSGKAVREPDAVAD